MLTLIGSFYVAGILFIVVIVGLIAYIAGFFSIFKCLKLNIDEIIIVADASSSEPALLGLLKN
ncbi:MAG: hypothetical protein ACRCR9_06280 [Chitinophagaceae bacterium]